MNAINTALQNITLGEIQAFQNLEITPLLAPAPGRASPVEPNSFGLTVLTE
jgi:hypothetical protein